jgi:hypothetical protein
MSTQFWDRLWRSAGIQFVIFFVIAYFVYGDQPKVGSSPDTLASFYDGNRMRILIATFIFGLAVLYLLWFAAAIRSVLRDTGQDGWGAAVTASSAALGGMLFVLMTVGAALAYKIAGSDNNTLTSGLNDVVWPCCVMTSFPRAMLIMAGTFGLWRAGIISNALFGAGVAALLLVLLGGSTWATDGIWAPDGAYSRFISPIICIAWVLVTSGVILKSPSTVRTPDRGAVPQW